MIAIIDLGSQYTHLIARKVREVRGVEKIIALLGEWGIGSLDNQSFNNLMT